MSRSGSGSNTGSGPMRPFAVVLPRSRSEQAPGSEFHPRDESEKVDFDFLGPSWCKKKVDPER